MVPTFPKAMGLSVDVTSDVFQPHVVDAPRIAFLSESTALHSSIENKIDNPGNCFPKPAERCLWKVLNTKGHAKLLAMDAEKV